MGKGGIYTMLQPQKDFFSIHEVTLQQWTFKYSKTLIFLRDLANQSLGMNRGKSSKIYSRSPHVVVYSKLFVFEVLSRETPTVQVTIKHWPENLKYSKRRFSLQEDPSKKLWIAPWGWGGGSGQSCAFVLECSTLILLECINIMYGMTNSMNVFCFCSAALILSPSRQ